MKDHQPEPIIQANPGILPPAPRLVRFLTFHCTQCLTRGHVELPQTLAYHGSRPRCPYCGTREAVIVDANEQADAGVYARQEAIVLAADALIQHSSDGSDVGAFLDALTAALEAAKAGFYR